MNFEGLNEQQFEAITDSFDNNIVTIAGAGSGKTSVLTQRIGYLIEGLEVAPENIMAVTFTRKAANEMISRIERNVGYAYGLWIGTFHSICRQLLKKFGSYVNIEQNFTVLNEFASRDIIAKILKKNEMDYSKEDIEEYSTYISANKNYYNSPNKLIKIAKDIYDKKQAMIYKEYMDLCIVNNWLDYDDLIYYTIKLTEIDIVSNWLGENIKYLLVDEYQDVNHAQYLLVKNIVNSGANLFVVGDVKQSIYSFRCSDPIYLENFNTMYPNTKTLYLDRNYRSTKNIVMASNSLIEKNKSKFDVKCFTENEDGEQIKVRKCNDERDEAEYIVSEIISDKQFGINYEENAILFRNNSLSASIEEELIKNSIPYYVQSGFAFFERAEIKDILAFMHFSTNVSDKESFERVLKCMDGIGKKTAEEIINYSEDIFANYYTGMSEYIEELRKNAKSKKTSKIEKLQQALDVITNIAYYDFGNISELVRYIYESINYKEKLYKNYERKTSEDKMKIQNKISNVNELINISDNMHKQSGCMSIEEFLEKTQTTDNEELDGGKVKLISIHSAKGLEYENVYICGVEKHILPSCLNSNTIEDIEEERRLMYVAMTRAKKKLTITHCHKRKKWNKDIESGESPFIAEIDQKFLLHV